MKLQDRYASTDEITLKDKSVISKKSIAQMEKSPDKVYGWNIIKRDSTVKDKKTTSKEAKEIIDSQLEAEPAEKDKKLPGLTGLLKNASEKNFYEHVEPMLATLVDQPFDNDEWIYEIKWDG